MTTSPEAETSSYTEYDDTALAGAELEKTYTSVPVHLVFSATKSMAYVQFLVTAYNSSTILT